MTKWKRGVPTGGRPFLIAGYTILALILVASVPSVREYAQNTVDDIRFRLNPTAAQAFMLGNKYFNAADPAHYDVERAKYYFYKAVELDVDHPAALQQIARTSFVTGNIEGSLAQIDLHITKHPDTDASAYYIRALAYGFLGNYAAAAKDFERYIELRPSVWAAYNDLAWIKLKSNRPDEALTILDRGLTVAPENAWLLSAKSAALYELGRSADAYDVATRAVIAAEKVTVEEWALMYTGNDPKTFEAGMRELRQAGIQNLDKIREKIASEAQAQ